MAESTGKKGKKSIDNFADDLDSMLGVDESPQHKVGLIDDDDAIDRLLMGDVFPDDDRDQAVSADAVDQLLDGHNQDSAAGDGFPEDIDDIIAGMDIAAKRQAARGNQGLDELDVDVAADDLTALDKVELVDEFEPDHPDAAEDVWQTVEETEPETARADEFERMNEIDEFFDVPGGAAVDNADFLLADFNISADDDEFAADNALPVVETPPQPDPVPVFESAPAPITAAEADEFADGDLDLDFVLNPPQESAGVIEEALVVEPAIPTPPPVSAAPIPVAVQIDHSAELAALTAQIHELKKQQHHARQEFELKVNKQELTECLMPSTACKPNIKKPNAAWMRYSARSPLRCMWPMAWRR